VLGILLVWQARRLPEAAASSASRRPFDRSEAAAMLVFGVLAIAYVVAGIAGLKLGIVTLSGGLVLAAVLRSLGADTTAYRRTFSPGLLVFVAALVLLVECVSAAGVLARLSDVMDALAGQPLVLAILGSAVAGTILSNVMNNWPAAVLLTAVIAAVPGNQQPLVAGALIGCTIGGNLTVVGSLSTVFWLSLSSRAGLRISALHYLQNAWLPTLAGLAAASLVASASLLR
jgi:Na+/H+ antiporter NhaD/arsenite permease-like protein